MKKLIIIFLTIISVVSLISANYFVEQKNELESYLNKNINFIKDAKKLAEANRWIAQNPAMLVEVLDDAKATEEKLLNLQSNLKELFNTNVSEIDKSRYGIMSISLSAKIRRNDIDKLLKLYKLSVKNGYVNFKQISISNNYVINNFNIVMFYKGS